MEFGAFIFFTDYSITPAALGVARSRSVVSTPLWAANIRIFRCRGGPPPGGANWPGYYDVMDPFVTLAVAAATKKLKVPPESVCDQRDTIQTAKLVASIDQVSGDVSCSASAAAER
jgi:hypothetical protein